jgi:hypothetical protein
MDALRRLAQADQPAEPAAPPQTLAPVDDDFDDFLALFDDLRGLAPSSFFLLFKIARILKSPDAKLAGQLKGFFDVCARSDRTATLDTLKARSLAEHVPVIAGHDPHFGLRRIKSIEEVGAVRPHEVAEEDFTELLRKAEEQQLQVRVLVHDGEGSAGMETAPIKDRGSRQIVNAAEQKLYILLDRSYSMWYRQRMLYAKVLAFEYLRHKKRTGARLFFRPFDFEVYDLIKLAEPADYDRLFRHLLYIEPGGKGTDIGHAIEVAAQDIRFDGLFEGAEVLLITDGMDRIDPAHLKEVLGEKTKLHLVKIGRDAAEPQPTEIKDLIEKDKSIAGLSRDQIAEYYQRQITTAWQEVTETLLETDDLDEAGLDFGEPEVQFALRATEKVTGVDPPTMSLAETETAFRKATFLEGFIEVMLNHAEDVPAIAQRQTELNEAAERLRRFKVRLATKSGGAADLLAGKEVRFINDKTLRKQAKKPSFRWKICRVCRNRTNCC